MMDEQFESELAKTLSRDLKQDLKQNGGSLGKPTTLTDEIDRVIAACQHRIKLLEAIKSTL